MYLAPHLYWPISTWKPNSLLLTLTMQHPLTEKPPSGNRDFSKDSVRGSWSIYVQNAQENPPHILDSFVMFAALTCPHNLLCPGRPWYLLSHGIQSHRALPSESHWSWPVPLGLMPHSQEGGYSPLFTLCLPLFTLCLPSDPLVFSGPNALAETTSVSAPLSYALSLTPALAGRTLDMLNL